mmetsp:Transcript_11258/g.35730  ORF Transcript_11258/g.35730 Transcript_11258/m.35730 type:complete len:212 (-) Transcript_11258:22-657(-)
MPLHINVHVCAQLTRLHAAGADAEATHQLRKRRNDVSRVLGARDGRLRHHLDQRLACSTEVGSCPKFSLARKVGQLPRVNFNVCARQGHAGDQGARGHEGRPLRNLIASRQVRIVVVLAHEHEGVRRMGWCKASSEAKGKRDWLPGKAGKGTREASVHRRHTTIWLVAHNRGNREQLCLFKSECDMTLKANTKTTHVWTKTTIERAAELGG